jgi:HPt (histidine-containing phosphotransfer) domain-containing protein
MANHNDSSSDDVSLPELNALCQEFEQSCEAWRNVLNILQTDPLEQRIDVV